MKTTALARQFLTLLVITTLHATAADGPVENFQKDWKDPKALTGVSGWKAVSPAEVQYNTPAGHAKSKTDPMLVKPLEQSGVMQYEWSLKLADFKQGCAFYLFSADPAGHDAYAIWLWLATDKATGEKQTRLNVDKITNHKLVPVKFFPITLKNDDWNRMRVKFDSAKGAFTVWCNGEEVAQCTDPKPFTKGSYVALSTAAPSTAFKELSIRKLP